MEIDEFREMLGVPRKQETDPTGRNPNEPGAKLDEGKPMCGLVLLDFANALEEVSKVGTYGAKKYSKSGWVSVPEGRERYTNAMLRHLLEEGKGNQVDAESGLKHSAQVAWNALARLELELRKSQ